MLKNFLDNPPNGGADVQRIIMLEDLPRSFVEVIGSWLRIPPSFFGNHWQSPETPFMRRALRHDDSHCCFMLDWRKLHRANIVAPKGDGLDAFLMASNVLRAVTRISLFGESDGVTLSSEKLSFRGVRSNSNSWSG
jgi:hypothetical protein